MNKPLQVEYDGRTFRWSGGGWVDVVSYRMAPPSVQFELNRRAYSESGDGEFLDTLDEARTALDAGKPCRAERLAVRALRMRPAHEEALATLCMVYRQLGRPHSVLALVERLTTNYRPLLTTLASALCDVERWVEAKNVISKVFAIGGTGEAFTVMHRIKAARPDLFPGSDLSMSRRRPDGDAA